MLSGKPRKVTEAKENLDEKFFSSARIQPRTWIEVEFELIFRRVCEYYRRSCSDVCVRPAGKNIFSFN